VNRMRVWMGSLTVAALAAASPAHAQDRGKSTESKAPATSTRRPPPGLCQVWVDNVPARQQPAPTDCASAVRNRPPNGRVIFPDPKAPPPKATPAPKGKEKKPPPKSGSVPPA
jgi:hypothetical protein